MASCKGLAAIAACVALTCGEIARASDLAPDPKQALSLTPTISADDAPRKPLMHTLDRAGVASDLDEWGINVGGFAEASYTVSFEKPDNGLNTGRIFDIENEAFTLNQFDLFVERAVAPSPTKIDFGGRMEWIYGSDARFIHANGVMDNDGFRNGPKNQFDPVQAYLQMNVPVGNGVIVTAGKFVTLMGYETINPTTNPLFSHSFEFYFGIPFTTTGVTGKYAIDKNYSFTLGVVRGWDEALDDNNDVPSYTGQFVYNSENFDFYFNFITGPEENKQNSNYRTVVEGIVVYRVNDALSLALMADYGVEPTNQLSQSGTWWNTAGYVTYKLDNMFTLQGRAEYFDDNDGVRSIGTQIAEFTVGVNIKPMPDDVYGSGLMIRPEIRWDYANEKVFNVDKDADQVTFGIDAIYSF